MFLKHLKLQMKLRQTLASFVMSLVILEISPSPSWKTLSLLRRMAANRCPQMSRRGSQGNCKRRSRPSNWFMLFGKNLLFLQVSTDGSTRLSSQSGPFPASGDWLVSFMHSDGATYLSMTGSLRTCSIGLVLSFTSDTTPSILHGPYLYIFWKGRHDIDYGLTTQGGKEMMAVTDGKKGDFEIAVACLEALK